VANSGSSNSEDNIMIILQNWTHQVRARLSQHLAKGTTDRMIDTVHRFNARDTYVNPSRDQVALNAPFFLCPSALLAPGQALAEIHPDGTPLLVHRNRRDHSIQAYVNQCRHRGAPLLKSGSHIPTSLGENASLVCPYHAWTYDASTGALRGVPGSKNGFPRLEKDQHSLVSIDCIEMAGGIWVFGNNPSSSLVDCGLWKMGDVHHELEPLVRAMTATRTSDDGPSSSYLIGYREWNLNANWQLLVETFLESYHVSSLHSDTLAKVAVSNIMVSDVLDEHNLRMTTPLKNFSSSLPDAPLDPDNPFLGQTTTTFFLFPNSAVTLFKRFVLFLSILPTTGPSASRVRSWGMVYSSQEDSRNLQTKRDLESVLAGIEEDWDCSVEIQRGLESKASQEMFTLGRFEGNNVHFLNAVGMAAEHLKR
jgi:phenylpropionate dioxygenase-like ring-hydroxylating dioxygenase large terminal subunit